MKNQNQNVDNGPIPRWKMIIKRFFHSHRYTLHTLVPNRSETGEVTTLETIHSPSVHSIIVVFLKGNPVVSCLVSVIGVYS